MQKEQQLAAACEIDRADVAERIPGLTGEDACSVFSDACRRGHRDVVVRLLDTYDIYREDCMKHDVRDAFDLACLRGHLSVVTELLARFKFTGHCRYYICLQNACKSGNVQLVELLCTHYRFTGECVYAFAIASAGSVAIADWLYGHYKDNSSLSEFQLSIALEAAASRDIALVQWLLARYPCQRYGGAFIAACEHGRLEIVQFLVDRFDIRDRGIVCRGVAAACKTGQAETADWIYAVFRVSDAELAHPPYQIGVSACGSGNLPLVQLACDGRYATFDPQMLCTACLGGHFGIVEWLISRFNLTLTDARKSGISPIALACVTGDLKRIQWLASVFGFTAADVRANKTHALLVACCHGHLHVAKWLVATFQLTDDDFNKEIFTNTCSGGHLDVAKWLEETFVIPEHAVRLAFYYTAETSELDMLKWLIDTFCAGECDPAAARRVARNGLVRRWLDAISEA